MHNLFKLIYDLKTKRSAFVILVLTRLFPFDEGGGGGGESFFMETKRTGVNFGLLTTLTVPTVLLCEIVVGRVILKKKTIIYI